MINLLWKIVALILSRPMIVNWLIERALKTPYTHIYSRSGEIYMWRHWLFNPYGQNEDGSTKDAKWSFLPSIRLHQIMRPDSDDHPHDHPWDARTIILRNPYIEERLVKNSHWAFTDTSIKLFTRRAGDTATLKFGEFHRIVMMPKEGVYTLFFTWKFMGTWGFLVDGKKVPYKEYLK